ncbi:MAG: hypothetical protein JWO42_3249 [Chloroflexi bacterium]|nr:hypothetical protein [Chloroflexota bacterium]
MDWGLIYCGFDSLGNALSRPITIQYDMHERVTAPGIPTYEKGLR